MKLFQILNLNFISQNNNNKLKKKEWRERDEIMELNYFEKNRETYSSNEKAGIEPP